MKIESRKYINIRKIVQYLANNVATKLPQVHAVTECDAKISLLSSYDVITFFI